MRTPLLDTVVTHCSIDLDVPALREAWLADPGVAYATAPVGARRPGIAALGRDLLSSMGRPGVTWGRKHGERHFLRALPYWRTDAITDLVILDAQQLRIEGLCALLEATSAAPVRTWLLLTEPARPDVTCWLSASHTDATPWGDVKQYWQDRATAGRGRRQACPTAAEPPWVGTDPVGVTAWTLAPPDCPLHDQPARCLREALRGAHARGQLTPDQACAAARDHHLTLNRSGDADAALAAAVILGRDLYVPARTSLERLGTGPGTVLGDVSGAGGVLSSGRRPTPIEAAALAALRSQDALVGMQADRALLAIFGEAAGL